MYQVFRALLSHWKRNPWQLLTLLAGLALSTALWSGVQAINAEARASYAQASEVVGTTDVARVLRRDGAAMTVEEYVSLRRLGWLVSPVMEGELEHNNRTFRIVGVDPLTFPGPVPTLFAENNAPDGSASGTEPVAVINPADKADLASFMLELRESDTRPAGSIVMDISQADALLGEVGKIRRLLLDDRQSLGTTELPEAYRIAQAEVQADVSRLTRSFHLNLTAFGLLSFAVGIFIVYGAVGLAFEQRRAMLRTLRALGVPLWQLVVLLALELAVFAFGAGAVGVGLGYVIAAALLPDVAATLRGLYGADVSGQLQLRPAWWVSGFAMTFGGAGVAGLATLWKLANMPLLSFNHPRAMRVTATRSANILALLAVGLFGLSIAIPFITDGLLAGFGILACLLIGAAFCLPWFLSTCLTAGQRLSTAPLPQWFWADSRQQLPGLSMALMALLLAMAANIGVSTMVSSFRLTFTGYLDQRLASDLYVAVATESQAKEIEAFLATKVDAVLPIQSVDTRLGGMPAEVFGVIDHATYRDNWPVLKSVPGVWDQLAAGDGALINEQLARREGYELGDMLETGDRLLGVYSDYGNSSGQMIISAAEFRTRYPDAVVTRFGVSTDQPDAIADSLRKEFALTEDALINQADLKSFSLQVFERTFSVTAALNVLTLSVAGLAILISLLTLATMRLPQLAPVWALGMTRAHLARLELLRAVCLAALTGLFAVPLGLVLAWVLLAVVNVEAFGWRLPMYLFPLDYLKLGALTLLAAFLAALWPAVRLARTDAQSLLKVFSNER